MSKLINEIVSIIETTLNISSSTLGSDAAMDITDGWDSLKTMEIVVAIERHFNILFSARQIITLNSAHSIHEALVQNGLSDT